MSERNVKKSLTALVELGLVIDKGKDDYIVNPYFFGKAQWAAMGKIRNGIEISTNEGKDKVLFKLRD